MASSTLFTSNRSQAVRLPKAVAFPDDVHQVDVLDAVNVEQVRARPVIDDRGEGVVVRDGAGFPARERPLRSCEHVT
ncbi:MAG TPA: AbrB/MazE/SpoVT family DNA-binding domain-containing protein [Pseudoclavibacter sp.]|nr:AbrB/MazE/SpoVT family DNA-binding domain-containing protein [Pseudoclavibacter sp.]